MARQFIITYKPGMTRVDGYDQENRALAQEALNMLMSGYIVILSDDFKVTVLEDIAAVTSDPAAIPERDAITGY